ncbi:odorant receptor 83a-like [Culicoides brevitarsis]|uniref:odorant receptor 83a-like n=1 Tax=Culicoides brevitarsis TaxID=469753 RepID=UPI00307C4247
MNENFRQRSAPGLTYVAFDSGFKSAQKFLNYWVCNCFLGAGVYGMVPLLNGDRVLPLPTWYPFDLSVGRRFEAVYGLQYACQLIVGTIFANGMGYCMYLYLLFTVQLDILCASIKNIPFTALIKAKKDRKTLKKLQKELENTHQELNQYSLGEKSELLEDLDKFELNNESFSMTSDTFKDPIVAKYLKEAIADCVLHHQTIIELLKKVEKILSGYLFFKLWYHCILMGFILFVISVIDDGAQIFAFLSYMFILLTGLFILTFFGQVLTIQSSKIINAVMNSPWHLYMFPVKKELSILLARGTKPYVLSAGGLMTISIGTYIAIVKAAFSYYTLLIKMNKKP